MPQARRALLLSCSYERSPGHPGALGTAGVYNGDYCTLKNKLLLLAPYTVRAVARKRSGRESRAPIPTPSALPRAQKRRRGQAARRGALRI